MLNAAVPTTRPPVFCKISLILLAGVFFGALTARAQNTSNIERSPETITLIQQVLTTSGGVALIDSIHDVVETGTSSIPMNAKDTVDATATISLRGLDQLRIDATLPAGTRSMFYNHGDLSTKEADGTVVPFGSEDSVSSTSHFFPLGHLAAALQDSSYSLTAPETVVDEETGHNLYHFRLQRIRYETVGPAHLPISSVVLEYYIDATTNYIVRIKNQHSDRGYKPKDLEKGPFEIYDFSDYRLDSGVLLPHQIAASIEKRLISTTQISAYQLNTGLADSFFTPDAKQ